MTDPGITRPDPDQLLKHLDNAADSARRGRLRIYFGASAGVGKTYAMLSAARAQRDQGTDVVAGVVETHGRRETAGLLEGLEQLPPQAIAYRDRTLNEFDLPGALARHPQLLLIDELAHSNVPGARHSKRWQDVDELLDAGIDVWTTLNVQHLDSLNEAVGGITGIKVWETVPDAIFDAANEIILVDLSADELLRRLQEGRVYLPEQARHAGKNFFRKGNLIALRELALRRTADHVDDDVRAYRHERAIEPVWRTRETVLACIFPDPQAAYVVRSAHRLARQLECDLHVITVATPRIAVLPPDSQHHLEQAMALAEQLGASTETLAHADPAQAAVRYIRRHNITKAVVGRDEARSRPAVWLDALLGGTWRQRRSSLAEALSQACPDVDVIRIATPAVSAPGYDSAPMPSVDAAGETPSRPPAGYLWAALYCAIATLVSGAASPLLHQTNIVMFYLLAVVLTALRHGRGPAALAATISVGLFDYFFVQPLWSFAVSDVQYLLTFAVLLGVGLLIGQLTAGLQAQAQDSAKREADTRGLYEFARELSSALQAVQIVGAADTYLKAAFGARSALYVQGLDETLHLSSAKDAGLSEPDSALAQWTYDHGQACGAGTTTLSTGPLLYLPLRAPMRVRGVLALEAPKRTLYAEPETRRQLDAYATLIAIALERLHYVEVAQQALVGIESERLRNSLLAAVSHDLRTPLTSLIGMADTLARDPAALPTSARELANAMRDQARRMHALVVNLLDMARLQNHEATLRREWQSIEELVGAALADMKESLAGRAVTVDRLSDLPLVECDGVLIERVLCNLLENAAKYTPPGTPIRIAAAIQNGELQVAVSDRGPGVPPADRQRIFEKFTRGATESATPGVGLGLAVCRAILEAHRGRIWVDDPDTAEGARFVFALPLGVPPSLAPEPR
jgi:two-component system sensor histidine kinase KdpD